MPVHPVDIIVLLASVFFVVKGYQKGLIVEVITLVALILGIIAAMQLAGQVSDLLADTFSDAEWVFYAGYLLSFLVVFIGVQLMGSGLEKFLKATRLNFINRILGALGGFLKILFLVSLIFWLLDQAEGLDTAFKSEVLSYTYAAPVAPWLINKVTAYFPFLKDLIAEAEVFFKNLNQQIQQSQP